MNIKRFSKKLHQAHDPRAREAMTRYLMNRGYHVEENPDKLDTDLLVTINGDLWYMDVEVKLDWKVGSSFPYKDVHFQYKKLKHNEDKGRVSRFMYAILSDDLKEAFIISGNKLSTYTPKPKWTKYTPYYNKDKQELFIMVLLEDLERVRL